MKKLKQETNMLKNEIDVKDIEKFVCNSPGELITKIRKHKNLKQSDIAEALGISNQAVDRKSVV